MNQADVVVAVADAVETVLAGGRVEDDFIECKREFITNHARAARRIAALANTARGNDFILIIGLDEDAKKVCPVRDDFAPWWDQVKSRFHLDHTPEMEHHIRVPIGESDSVVALQFDSSYGPYVVTNPDGGTVTLEVPWREGTRTRSATRSDLLRILVPIAKVPNVEPVDFSVTTRGLHRTQGPNLSLQLRGRVYFSGADELATIPLHKVTAKLSFPTVGAMNLQLPSVGLDLNVALPDREYAGTSSYSKHIPVTRIVAPNPLGVDTRHGAIYVGRGGALNVDAEASMPMHLAEAIDETPEVEVTIEMPVDGTALKSTLRTTLSERRATGTDSQREVSWVGARA